MLYSTFKWNTGTPTEYGEYLVLCKTNNGFTIQGDVWRDSNNTWQS